MSGADTETPIADLKAAVAAFNRERDWEQFHQLKDLAMALSVEAGELLELFLWRGEEDPPDAELMRQELADVVITALNLANYLEVDVTTAVRDKMRLNAERYPVALSKGNAKKYTELG